MANKQESSPSDRTAETVTRLLEVIQLMAAEIHPEQESLRPDLDNSLDRDLGFDSLARMEMLSRLEKAFDISLPEQELAGVETVRDLLRAVLSSGSRIHEAAIREVSTFKLEEISDVPLGAETLVDVLRWHADKHPDRPHIRFYNDNEEELFISYLQLQSGAERIAAGLIHTGLEPGEAVLIMLPTGAEYFFTFFGVLMAGGIPVPVYPPGRLKQIEEHLLRHTAIAQNCMAGIMVTVAEAKQFARLMHTHVNTLRSVLTVPELNKAAADIPKGGLRLPVLSSQNTALLQYTSGSTGTPKGVVLSHANLLANIRAMARVFSVTPEDVFISWLPLYHDMGLIGAWLGSLHFACQLVIMEPLSFLAKPQRWLRAVHRYGGTLSAAPNFAFELCLRRITDSDIQGLDLTSWRIACNGAEAVNPETIRRFNERFGAYGLRPETVMPVYGLAESSVGLTFPRPGSTFATDRIKRSTFMDTGRAVEADEAGTETLEFASCGQPLPEHQVRIVDEADRELPERTEGSLQFKGPSSTSGYFRNTAKTSELFHGEWLDSGDKAYMVGGNVYITGRSKDIIIRAGRNIYPVELEEAVGKIEGVREGSVAVFGASSSESGTERLIVLAETRKKDPKSLERIRNSINSTVTAHVTIPPDEVLLAPPNSVLKTSSGKIRRNACREIYEQGLIGKPLQAVWLQLFRYTLKGVLPVMRTALQRLTAALYAAWCWLVFCTLAPVVGVLVFILPIERPRWFVMKYGVRLLALLTATKIKIHDTENLRQNKGPCIFVSNHGSYLDGYVLAAVLDRPISFVAKAELKVKPVVHVLLKKIGTLFVERFDRQKGIEDAQSIVRKGRTKRTLFFFPEGTFMRMPGLLPFRMGAFETSVHTGLPVIPIAIRGTRSILRADSWFPRHGMVSVTVGRPITPQKIEKGDDTTWKAALAIRDKTRSWLLVHCGEPDLGHERPRLQVSGPTLDQ